MSSIQKLQHAMQHAFSNRPVVGGFPYLAECLRQAGVTSNTWTFPAAQSVYVIDKEWIVQQGTPLVSGLVEVPAFDESALIAALRNDQSGGSTFPEFLEAVWRAGVIEYKVDFIKQTVTYRGIKDEIYSEGYGRVEVHGLSFM